MKDEKHKQNHEFVTISSPQIRSELRIGKYSTEKITSQMYTKWVDDDGHFGTRSLIKPLDQHLIFDGNDGLRDLG